MIDETVEEILDMQTHSSSVVAVKAAAALADLTEREFVTVEEYIRDLERNSSALRRANPSHASLFTTQRQVVDLVTEAEPESVEEAKKLTLAAIDEVVSQVEKAKDRAADNASSHLDDGMTILTHDYSSTVLEAVEQAAKEGKHLTVYVTEARPRYLGRKTARVLSGIDRVETHLLVDSACGHFLPECDAVFFGMDCIVGDLFYNRVGTFPISATATEVGVPVIVVGSRAKIIEDGFVFENEIRSGSEVMLEPAEGFKLENPAYDATPIRLIESVITDHGTQQF